MPPRISTYVEIQFPISKVPKEISRVDYPSRSSVPFRIFGFLSLVFPAPFRLEDDISIRNRTPSCNRLRKIPHSSFPELESKGADQMMLFRVLPRSVRQST